MHNIGGIANRTIASYQPAPRGIIFIRKAKPLAIKIIILHCLNYTRLDTNAQLSDSLLYFTNIVLIQTLLA